MRHDIIVVGASAGGVPALSNLVECLSREIPASVFVTLHLSPFSKSHLPEILERAGNLKAKHPTDKERVRKGIIYVAPPDLHMMLDKDRVRLGHGPKENRNRPSIDVLFRSAARSYGRRVAGVLLTGNLDDGVAGLQEIQNQGGLTIVQDPAEAPYPEMPSRALEAMQVNWCLSLSEIGSKLREIATEAKQVKQKSKHAKVRTQSPDLMAEQPTDGTPIALVCPECQGPIWEGGNGGVKTYRCLVGHRYTLESLLAAQNEEVEQALWVALRALEERVVLQRRLAATARDSRNGIAAGSFSARANKNTKHAKILRKILEDRPPR